MSDVDLPPPTQSSALSHRTYLWVILFNFDPDNEEPFSVVSLHHFKGSDFPFNLITGHLGSEDRQKPRNLSTLSGAKYCIFAKIEEGKKYIFYGVPVICRIFAIKYAE